jgi:hypothetical protein
VSAIIWSLVICYGFVAAGAAEEVNETTSAGMPMSLLMGFLWPLILLFRFGLWIAK